MVAARFSYAPDLETESQTAFLVGGGLVTMELEPFGDSWMITSVTFEFRPVKRD